MLFGIVSLLLVGGSWCLTGAIMGKAPKRGIDASMVQLIGAALSILIGTIIMCFLKSPNITWNVMLTAGACYVVAGILNCFMLQLMSYSMQHGPNGIIWSIIQSALIFSFLGGIVFFGVELTVWRGLGIILLATALMLFGFCKDNSTQDSGRHHWKIAAFVALTLASIQQNLSTAPSYFPEAREISSVLRTLLTAAGTFLVASCWQFVTRKASKVNFKEQMKSRYLWYYAGGLQIFSLFFSYLLLFPGMDALAELGAGAISYPLMVGSCIVTFTLYSHFILKEPMKLMQCVALLICILGLTAICL